MKLTNENIKAAINRMKFELIFAKSCRAISDQNEEVDEGIAMFEIALAALDACRWRDAETELPEPCELVRDEYGDLVYMNATGCWFYKTDVAEDEEMPRPKRWLPLPEWEG